MANFSRHFLSTHAGPFEFFDIPIDKDIPAFIDPFLIANNRTVPFINRIYKQTVSFFTKLNRNYIVPNNRRGGMLFLSKLHEPNEYHLGYSDRNKGKAISGGKAHEIYTALRNNRFVRSGAGITNEAHNVLLLVSGIGQDNISDTIANVCRNLFAEFTEQICSKYGIPTLPVIIEYYNPISKIWATEQRNLPHYLGKKIILIPQHIPSGSRSYSKHYNEFISKEYIAPELLSGKRRTSLNKNMIRTLKDGTKKAIIKEIYKTYKKPKQDLVDFVIEFKGSVDAFLRYCKEHYPELKLDNL
jgi:hypothetical protein